MLSIPQRLLGESLLISAGKNPLGTAVIVKGEAYSYQDLVVSAEKFASYLIAAGINKGDRVAVYMDNSWPAVVAIYGATLAGAVFLVINPQTKSDKLQYILNDCGAKILVTAASLSSEFSPAVSEVNSIEEIVVTGHIESMNPYPECSVIDFDFIIKKSFFNVEFPNIIPNDLAALIYTSGSTGFPKGVMMTHQSMVFTSWSLIEYLRL